MQLLHLLVLVKYCIYLLKGIRWDLAITQDWGQSKCKFNKHIRLTQVLLMYIFYLLIGITWWWRAFMVLLYASCRHRFLSFILLACTTLAAFLRLIPSWSLDWKESLSGSWSSWYQWDST